MTYAQYRKKNNLIISISKKPIKIDEKIMGQVKITKTQEKDILNPDNNAFVKGKKIKIEKKLEVQNKEKRLKIIEKIKNGQHSNKELADLLSKII